MEVVIEISDSTYRTVQKAALKARKRVDEIVAEKVEREFGFDVEALENELANCAEREVLHIFNAQMPKKQDKRLSNLLAAQQARTLSKNEQNELEDLMQIYRITNLRKAVALAEAVKRGLKLPFDE